MTVKTEISTIERFLADARRPLDRVEAGALAAEAAAGALVVDIRPQANRDAEGELPGAVVIERIHLEWRLDPTSPDRIPQAEPGRKVIVVCNEGYASSLAAWSLRLLGLQDATDLVGGYRAWRRNAASDPTHAEEALPWP
jgi:rhodanese-related sulfurtransferase